MEGKKHGKGKRTKMPSSKAGSGVISDTDDEDIIPPISTPKLCHDNCFYFCFIMIYSMFI